MDWTPYIAPIVTVLLAVVAFYGMVNARLARIETKVDDLVDDVQRHNHVVERTTILERDQKAAWRSIESNRNDIKSVRDEVHRLHSHSFKE